MRVGRTESVCPVCLRKLSAEKRTGADGYIYMDKQCPEHGKFSTLIWEDNLISYMRWNLGSSTVEPPVNGKDAKKRLSERLRTLQGAFAQGLLYAAGAHNALQSPLSRVLCLGGYGGA